MGININRVITLTFCIGGLTTGAAAFIYTTVYENTVFNVGFNMGIAAFTAAVLGGIGNLRGAFYGGIALGNARAIRIGDARITVEGSNSFYSFSSRTSIQA
jgi:branched-subunit amino acid ABC-type transport system permease component